MKRFEDDQNLYVDQSFKNINFSQKTLNAKQFEGCSFNECDFSEAIFNKCKFYECKFINCNLSMINISGSLFFDTIFENTKAIGINWTQGSWPHVKLNCPFSFYKCNLSHSSFFGLNLREIKIVECKAVGVDFREADCTEADFTYTDLSGSFFNKTNLTGAIFLDAQNYNINILSNAVKKAKFSLPEAVNLLRTLDIDVVD